MWKGVELMIGVPQCSIKGERLVNIFTKICQGFAGTMFGKSHFLPHYFVRWYSLPPFGCCAYLRQRGYACMTNLEFHSDVAIDVEFTRVLIGITSGGTSHERFCYMKYRSQSLPEGFAGALIDLSIFHFGVFFSLFF